MNSTKANLWLFNKKTKDITFSYETREKVRFIKGSLIAIILGLIVGGIIIAVQNVNPFTYLKFLFDIGFSGLFVNQTIQWLCIYIIAALAVGIGFKSGMFNIGVSGQMLMGAGIAIIFFKLAVAPHLAPGAIMNPGFIIVMFLICAGTGALMAGIAGALKALFNIHEVVTTIMLNWTAWYLMKYLFNKFANTIGGNGIQSSGEIPGGSLTIHGSSIAIPIIIAALAVIIISVLLAKTTFGFKLRSVGASPSASKYAGFNVKAKMIDAMLISGLLAGVASFINIFTITPNITFSVDTLPQIGYDSIAITLVAFNNPIGTVFSSFLWAVLQSGGSSAASMFNLPTQMSQLIFGVIVYFAAISVVFINWYPVIKLRIMIALTSSKANQLKIKNLRKEQLKYRNELVNINKSKDVQEYKKFIKEQIAEQNRLLNNSSKSKKDFEAAKATIKSLKNDMNMFVKEYKKNLREKIKKCSEQIKMIKNDNYISRINSAKEGIDRREWKAISEIEEESLSKASMIKSNVLGLKDKYFDDLKTKKTWMRKKLRQLRRDYKFKLKQNAVWLESETGIKNHFWEMRNGKIESKAVINKIKINSHNEILNIKSDAEMERLDLVSQFKNQPSLLKTKEKALNEKTNELISQVKEKEKYAIIYEHVKVQELTKNYKKAKKANEELAKQILAKKKMIKWKLNNYVTRANKTKVLSEKNELLSEAKTLLKELNDSNIKDMKVIKKINDKFDTDGVSLVDIQLACDQKNQRVKEWYEQQRQIAFDKHAKFIALIDTNKSKENYAVVKQAISEYKQAVKELGRKDTLATIAAKRNYLEQLIKTIKSVWTQEYDPIDNMHWALKRFRIYCWIDKQQEKLAKEDLVIRSQFKIKNIKDKASWIKKMYNQNIKTFKDQYMVNKKVDAIGAQQNYYKQIEQFISKLEKSDFSTKEVM